MEFLGMLLLAAIYFLPTAVAVKRNHESKLAIFVLNLLAGWTLLGWVAAFIWSFTNQLAATNAAPVGVGDELQKLADLKNSGVLTDAEFEAQKKRILDATAPPEAARRPENRV